jgi:4-amino-4-deoxychorismate lyase
MDSMVNGVYADSVSVHDRGLAYGDGLFETIAVRNGEPLLLAEHMKRLLHGCRRLRMPEPETVQLQQEIAQICQRKTGVLKIILTRGSSARGYAVATHLQTNRILLFSDWNPYPQEYYQLGIYVEICRTRLSARPELAGIKHLNRLENVLAAQELNPLTTQEGIMLDGEDRVIEGIRSNIFMVMDNQLHTPSLQRCGVEGIMRDHILGLARDGGIKTSVRDISLEELQQADEVFVCNSLIGVWCITQLGNKISYRSVMGRTLQSQVSHCTLGLVTAHA